MIALKVYVTPEDHAAIKRAADAERRSLSSYVAVAAVEKAKEEAKAAAAVCARLGIASVEVPDAR